MAVNFEFKENYTFSDLVEIVKILRAPGGCPWDMEQNHKSIREDFLEETYEVLEDENKIFNTEIEEHIDTVETHNRIKIQKLMSVLDDRERAILELYFGLNGDDMTLDDIGEMLNISKERVRQCKVNAIRKMREELMLSEFF